MARPGSWLSFARLFRLSIALSPAADVAAGFVIGLGGRPISSSMTPTVACACLASMAAFCFGASLNDYVDRKKDAELTPERPIPSGAIKPGAALVASLIMGVVALGLAFLCGPRTGAVMGLVLCLIASYNLFTRRSDVAGVVNLGCIRAADMLVGATLVAIDMAPPISENATIGIPLAVAMALYGLHGICLSTIALNERAQKKIDLRLPALIVGCIALWPVYLLYQQEQALTGLIIWAVLVLPVYRFFSSKGATPVEALVGQLVSGFFLLAALFVLTWGHPILCIVLWAGYFISVFLAKWFPPA